MDKSKNLNKFNTSFKYEAMADVVDNKDTKMSMRERFGSVRVVTSNTNLLFSFLISQLVWLKNQSERIEFESISQWASKVLDSEHGVSYHRSLLVNLLRKLCI